MRFDTPLLITQALMGSAALAAFIPGPPNRAPNHGNGLPIEQIEQEIAYLEHELEHEIHQIEQLAHQHQHSPHPHWPAPASSSSLSAVQSSSTSSAVLASSSIPVTSAAVGPSGSAATASSSANSTTSVEGLPGSYSISSPASASTLLTSATLTSAASTSSILSSSTDAASTLASASHLAVFLNDTLCSLTAAYSSVASLYPTSSVNASVSSLLVAASSYIATASLSTSTSLSASATGFVSSLSSAAASSYVASSSPLGSANSSISSSQSTVAVTSPVASASVSLSSSIVASNTKSLGFGNSTSTLLSGSVTAASSSVASASISISGSVSAVSSAPFPAGNSTTAFVTGSATASSNMAPTGVATSVSPSVTGSAHCTNLCNTLTFSTGLTVKPVLCQAYSANDTISITGTPAADGCGTAFTAEVDLCRISIEITTSSATTALTEIWLPNGNTTAWNGRTMSTDNGGLNGCVHYVDMQYVSGLGFAAIGDNGGHNSGAFDGGWMYENNEAIVDWAYRARHESVQAGKDVVDQFYGKKADKSYYIGCSTGGQQGLHSAQYFPDDFDGIIAGSSAADFAHLEDWSARFIQLTGNSSADPRFLTEDQWITVQSYIFAQCDEALDGVNDGILEDPTICQFDASPMVCGTNNTGNCLTATQVNTVEQVFTELYNTEGELLYPQLLYGSQVDAFRLGQLSGSVQGIAKSFYQGGVYNNTNFDVTQLDQADYAKADSLDVLHGNVSSWSGDLSAFHASGGKMIMYHGMADPLVSGGNSQRYYLKVAKTMGLSNTGLDDFMRLFRISGMAHCGVGGIAGAGAWMFGQNGEAAVAGVADNIVDNLVDWVENGKAPATLTGTKFWWDMPELGIEFVRPHCRFPYRTTFLGGDSTKASAWGCTFIDDWQECGVGAHPRLCNADGTFV